MLGCKYSGLNPLYWMLIANRPDDALLHCLKLTSPAMVLMDEERVEQFSNLQSSLPDTQMYCWSELPRSVPRRIKVSAECGVTGRRTSSQTQADWFKV